MFNLALTCSDAPNALWGVFDFSIAPPLLFYAYIPIIIISLFFGVFVLIKDKYSYRSKLLLWLSIIFTLLLLNEILQWVAAPVSLVQFGWELVPFFRILVSILTIWFVYVFINGKNLPFYQQIILSSFFLVTVVLLGTQSNIMFFDLNNCESVPGWLWNFAHLVGAISMIWVAIITFGNPSNTQISKDERNRDLFLGGAAILFLLIFLSASVWGDLTKVYDVALIGPAGMVAFMAFLTFIIVRYKAFDIKLVGAQALIVSLIALMGSEFFFIQSTTNQILTAIALVVTGVIGINLIRSVKKEVAQREHIEILATELQDTNERQETLIHFIGHEVKGFLTKDAGAFAALVDGDFGKIEDKTKDFVESALAESRSGVNSVSNILKASNLKKGTVTYTKAPFDLAALAADVVQRLKPNAERKGLSLTLSAEPSGAPYMFIGDKENIGDHVVRNLIDNAVNYTPTGHIDISLKKQDGNIVFSVKDTGIGITEEDKKRLFTEGGHGQESQKVNVHSTGYGLYIAKQIVVAHGGTVRAESEGQGKGSTFIVELPITGDTTFGV